MTLRARFFLLAIFVPTLALAQMGNPPPVVDALSFDIAPVPASSTVTITCDAHDPNGDVVGMRITVTGGALPGGGLVQTVPVSPGPSVSGSLVWTKTASGAQGLDGDERSVYGAEADGMVQAWGYGNGEPVWIQDKLRYRKLSTPVVLGRSVVVGDESGWVHFLSRENGSFLTRVATDGSGLAAAPVLAGNTLVLVTQNGNIFGFRPE